MEVEEEAGMEGGTKAEEGDIGLNSAGKPLLKLLNLVHLLEDWKLPLPLLAV